MPIVELPSLHRACLFQSAMSCLELIPVLTFRPRVWEAGLDSPTKLVGRPRLVGAPSLKTVVYCSILSFFCFYLSLSNFDFPYFFVVGFFSVFSLRFLSLYIALTCFIWSSAIALRPLNRLKYKKTYLTFSELGECLFFLKFSQDKDCGLNQLPSSPDFVSITSCRLCSDPPVDECLASAITQGKLRLGNLFTAPLSVASICRSGFPVRWHFFSCR